MFSSFQLNGLQTLGENIADNGAIKQAFEVGYNKDMENWMHTPKNSLFIPVYLMVSEGAIESVTSVQVI